MYRQYLRLNRNVILGFAASLGASAVAAQLLAGEQAHLNATYTLLVDYTAYFGVFGTLYYMDWKGRKVARPRREILKIIASLAIAEAAYTAARWLIQYNLLTTDLEPYVASLISQAISTIIYMAVLNITARMARTYDEA